jgi:hypothetical protein
MSIEKRDPMEMFHSAPKHKIVTPAQEKTSRDSRNAETDLQTKICKWLKKDDILFISDFAAGMKLSPFLASVRSLQSCNDKMVDLIILKPSGQYNGLCIELKTRIDKVFMKDGVTLLKNEHTLAQYETIKKLRSLGYAACFGCGEDHIKQIVSDYMGGVYVDPEYIERKLECCGRCIGGLDECIFDKKDKNYNDLPW